MKRNLHALTAILATAFCAVCLTGCASATAATPEEPPEFAAAPTDYHMDSPDPCGAVRVIQEQELRAALAAQEAAGAEEEAEMEYEADWGYYEPYSGPQAVMGNPDGLNSFDGVNYYNGKTESYYASRAVYDSELTVDDEGFYRSGDYYVVASSDYAQGTVIETSQGEAIVVDDGASEGVVDFHVTWGR